MPQAGVKYPRSAVQCPSVATGFIPGVRCDPIRSDWVYPRSAIAVAGTRYRGVNPLATKPSAIVTGDCSCDPICSDWVYPRTAIAVAGNRYRGVNPLATKPSAIVTGNCSCDPPVATGFIPGVRCDPICSDWVYPRSAIAVAGTRYRGVNPLATKSSDQIMSC